MWLRRVPMRKILRRAALAAVAAQTVTLASLAVVDHRRKKKRGPVVFPRVPPRSVTAGGSEVTVYTYGEDLYADMLGAVRQAKKQIFFETFIWKADEVGQRFKDELIAAAERGVRVYIVYDEFANLVVPRSFFRFPNHPNIKVKPHRAAGRTLPVPRRLGRNHRKLVVVDSDVAFIGGYNIGSLYATNWRDTHARLTGDIVWDMQNAFIDYWNLFPRRRLPALPDTGGLVWQPNIRLYRNVPRNLVFPIRGMYLEAIDRASDHIYLTHAYLIPDDDMVRALTQAADRGVDVRIIVPEESNHIVADWLSRGVYTQLLRGGVRLFLYQGAMVHAKTASIDGHWSTIGTANIDRLSLAGNYEINIEVFSDAVAQQLEEIFAVDAGNCRELTLDEWHSRPVMVKFSESVLTPFRPLL
jgi:cardiolipin synthase